MKSFVISVVILFVSVVTMFGVLDLKLYDLRTSRKNYCKSLCESMYSNSSGFEFQQTENEKMSILKQIHYGTDSDDEKMEEPGKPRKYIFIGDGRTVNLSVASNSSDGAEFLCRVGADYHFMVKMFKEALNRCEEDKENIIVSWFGIENPKEAHRYSRFFNRVMVPEDVKLVVLSLTDGYDSRKVRIKIEPFNDYMEQNAKNYKYIDLTDEIGIGKELDVTDKERLYYIDNSDEVFEVIMNKLEELEI